MVVNSSRVSGDRPISAKLGDSFAFGFLADIDRSPRTPSRNTAAMDELIKQLTSQIGIDSSTANQAVATVMSLLQKEGGDDLFSKIAAAIPGAQAAADMTPAPTESAGGGGLLGSVMGMLGGSAGKGLALAAALKGLGISEDKLGSFATIVIDFIKQKAGPDVVNQLIAQLPMLKSMLG
jgi:hypothetical protein